MRHENVKKRFGNYGVKEFFGQVVNMHVFVLVAWILELFENIHFTKKNPNR